MSAGALLFSLSVCSIRELCSTSTPFLRVIGASCLCTLLSRRRSPKTSCTRIPALPTSAGHCPGLCNRSYLAKREPSFAYACCKGCQVLARSVQCSLCTTAGAWRVSYIRASDILALAWQSRDLGVRIFASYSVCLSASEHNRMPFFTVWPAASSQEVAHLDLAF